MTADENLFRNDNTDVSIVTDIEEVETTEIVAEDVDREEITEEQIVEEAITEEEITEEGPLMPLGLDDDILGDVLTDDLEDDMPFARAVGVRFRTAGKIYYFTVGDLTVKRGDHVIVETARGIEYGFVVCDPMEIDRREFKIPLKQIIRLADAADDARVKENREKEREAYKICFEKIRKHNLEMKLIDAEYTFDNNKILFYFTADGRVDFRDLVKDLAGIFRVRIELRQIGVRDETKILGGYGICGRPLCCHSYLSDFVPVSIKMAKEQNLSLNPTKISGVCGRLMCCLKNEEETYEELNKILPKVGDEVQGNDGLTGEVESVNILRQKVRILVEVEDEKELHEYAAGDVQILRKRKRGTARPKAKKNEQPVQNTVPEKKEKIQEAHQDKEHKHSHHEERFEQSGREKKPVQENIEASNAGNSDNSGRSENNGRSGNGHSRRRFGQDRNRSRNRQGARNDASEGKPEGKQDGRPENK